MGLFGMGNIGEKIGNILSSHEKNVPRKFLGISDTTLFDMLEAANNKKDRNEIMAEINRRCAQLVETNDRLQPQVDAETARVQQDLYKSNALFGKTADDTSNKLQACISANLATAQKENKRADSEIEASCVRLKSELDRKLGSAANDPDLDQEVEDLIDSTPGRHL